MLVVVISSRRLDRARRVELLRSTLVPAQPDQPNSPPATVVEYDHRWPADFTCIAAAVDDALGDLPHQVEHIGSTAVPGLAAKPIIDLFVVVASAAQVAGVMTRLGRVGWSHEGDGGIRGRDRFAAREGLPYHHLYLVVEGNEPHQAQIAFHDLLRTHPRAAEEYANLKRHLGPLLATDRSAYAEGKTDLISHLTRCYAAR